MSPAARFDLLLDLYAPRVEREDGTIARDPEYGVISADDFRRLLDWPDAAGVVE